MLQLVTEEAQEETNQALGIVEIVEEITIMNAADYEVGRGLMKKVKDRIKELNEIRKGQTRPLDDSKKKIMEFFREPMKRLEDVKAKLNASMVNWAEIQESKRREEERRIQGEARKKAEEETIKAALEAEAAGDKEAVEEILEKEIEVKPVKVESTVPVSRDSHIRETWSAEVVSLRELVKAVAEGKISHCAVCPDMKFLNALAREVKGALDIPGVKAVSKKIQI